LVYFRESQLTSRCVRHSLIFDLPWPAHTSAEVLDYPPSHLIPQGYIPPRVSSIALPSLDKNRKKHVEPAPVSPVGESHQDKRARKFRDELALEDLRHEQLREAAWTAQDTVEKHARAVEEAKEAAKQRKLDTKRARDENRIKGSGVWQRYEYISEEEITRREAAKHAVTSGTRRGGRFRAEAEEAEARRLAEQVVGQRLKQEAREREDDADDEDDDRDDVNDPDDIEPIISPVRPAPKVEPPDSAKKINKPVMDVIEISDSEEEDFTILGDSATSQFIRGARTIAQPANDSSDDCVLVSSSPRKRLEPMPVRSGATQAKTGAKTKPKAIAPSAESSQAGPSRPRGSASAAGLETETTKRGRGRPEGSGKKQKAAARIANRHAGPSNVDETVARAPITAKRPVPSVPSPRKANQSERAANVKGNETASAAAVIDQPDILTSIEKRLSTPSCKYTCLIEGLGDQGEFCWKSMGIFVNAQSDADIVLESFISEEHSELQTHLSKQGSPAEPINGLNVAAPPRRLPGQRRLLSSAEVKAWSEMRGSTAAVQFATTPLRESLRFPKNMPQGIEVVGLLLDSNTVRGYFRPSDTAGPWQNGQYRMFATIESPANARAPPAGEILGNFPSNSIVSPTKRNGSVESPKVPDAKAPPSGTIPDYLPSSSTASPLRRIEPKVPPKSDSPVKANAVPADERLDANPSNSTTSSAKYVGPADPARLARILAARAEVPDKSPGTKSTQASNSPKRPPPSASPVARRQSLHGTTPNGSQTKVSRFVSQTASILLNQRPAPKIGRTSVAGAVPIPVGHGFATYHDDGWTNGKSKARDDPSSSGTSTTVSPAEAEVEEVLNNHGKRKPSTPELVSHTPVEQHEADGAVPA
jgi:hypothetical protein